MEPASELLPTLGWSVNLNEPWAPRKDTSRSFVHCLCIYCEILSNFSISLESAEHPPEAVARRYTASGAQRPTPCEAEGRASFMRLFGAKHSKAKWSEMVMLAKVQKWGVPDDNGKNMLFGQNRELVKPESLATRRYGHFKASRFQWYQPFGCAPPTAFL